MAKAELQPMHALSKLRRSAVALTSPSSTYRCLLSDTLRLESCCDRLEKEFEWVKSDVDEIGVRV